ncbi:hypothetical protein B296_00042127 [Ensete ventricosum]|uniref:Uncharacterized protein n=1 Tax=Ensete ventricosum TaxID=4639 RepID=A0A426XFR3_ENSVE|nr:hypothetical protein B296_00042127 [Ensete ventricosum]
MIVVPSPPIVEPPPQVVKKCQGVGEDKALKKRSRVATFGQPMGATGSFTKALIEKGKESTKTEEVQEHGYSIRDALIDRVHDGRWMVRMQHERITVPRAANKELKIGAMSEVVAATEQGAKELQANIDQLRAELESSKRLHKDLKQEVDTMHASLQGAQDDRARLEEDVLSLTEALALLEAKLKAKGLKVLIAYKASRRFKSGLKKMG